MMAGFNWREEQVWERAAWSVAHLMNISTKRVRARVTVQKLLRAPPRAQDQQAWWDRVIASRKKNGNRDQEGG